MAKLLLYCTKGKPNLWYNNKYSNGNKHFLDGAYNRIIDDLPIHLLNGKIVAECDFEVEALKRDKIGIRYAGIEDGEWLNEDYYEYKSCLGEGELFNYIKN